MADYIDLLKRALLDTLYGSTVLNDGRPATEGEIKEGRYHPSRALTMIGWKRLTNIQQCAETVFREGISGDFIETGVWRGGATIFMKGLIHHHKEVRRVFVADSFEGLPPPDPAYPVDAGDAHHTIPYLAVSQETVQESFRRFGLLDDSVVFVKGFFEHSLKKAPIERLAILRMDGDMYSSTMQTFEALYDKVSVGGFIIIDDYGLYGCRAAVHDFRASRGIDDLMIPIDFVSVYWRKTKA